MQTGWAPSRWGIGLTVLLEKIAGVALVNKTRAILLMEGDYNMHNRVIFEDRMMSIAREHDLIPDDQYAEKESDGQDGAFMKRLVYDFSRLMKIALGIVSEDALNCYDRIAHPFCSLVFQAFGVAIASVIAMLSCIQRMKFYLRTAFGESPGFMTALLGTIIQGLCQGNAASPAGWSVVCAILLAAYNQGGHGAKIKPPIRGDHLETAGVLYVDDVDLFTLDAELDEEALWTEIQSSTLDWSGVLIGSGGTAKGEKCFGYLADYTWDDSGQWHYAPPPTKPLVILLPDGTTEEITVLPCDIHQVTLGVASSPDGNDQHHLAAEGKARDKWKSIRTKAEVWVNRLKNAHLPSKYVWVSYRLQLRSSVRYSLGVLSARLNEMTELCPRFAFDVLPYLGINRRVRKGWRYMHSAFGGFGLLDLATEVVISRVNLFLQHWDNPAPIGKTLQACMQALQLQCGCQGCPLAERFYPMGELCDHSWVTSFWECVSAYSIMIEMDYPDLPLPRANHQMIMQVAISLGYTLTQLRSVNRCRISSCSLFLSDIASADGRRIDPTRALPDVGYSATSAFDWPIERPSAADWRTWQAFLLRLSLPDGTLLRTLGKWLYPSHRQWEWFYDPVSDIITRRLEDRHELYCLCPDDGPSTRQAQQYACTRTISSSDEVKGVPISVIDAGTTIQRLAAGPPLAVTERECPGSFLEFLHTWKGEWMWEDLHMPLGLDAVVSSIRNGSAVYVTDGSYMRTLDPLIDGAGWLIYCRTARRIVLKGSMAERSSKAGSYRGELLGLLAIHLWVAAIEEFYQLEEGPRGLIACDNLGALNKAQLRRKKIKAGAKHSDILRVMRRLHNQRRGRRRQSFEYKHVYGHQDQQRLWRHLTLLEKLNCKCDSLAKAAVSRALREGIPVTYARQLLPSESVAVFYNRGKLSSECGDNIRYQVGRVKARQFYVTQLGWSGAAFDQVDWEARDHALKGKPDMFKTWLAKQTSTFCATGLNMVRWFDSARCPIVRIAGLQMNEPVTCCIVLIRVDFAYFATDCKS